MTSKVYSIYDIKIALHPIFNAYNVKKAALFGSYVKGLTNQNSDVFDVSHIVPNSRISSEIAKDGVAIYG